MEMVLDKAGGGQNKRKLMCIIRLSKRSQGT